MAPVALHLIEPSGAFQLFIDQPCSVSSVDAEGKVERRPVRVGRSVGDQWLVEDGLAAGDRVIVEGLQKIRPGVPVQPAEAGEPAAAPAPGQ